MNQRATRSTAAGAGGNGRLRVGVIGLGYWGPNLARNLAGSERTDLVAMADNRPDRLEAMGRLYPACALYPGGQELLGDPDVDAVMIATPVRSHYELALAALRAGKHVLLEKPFVETRPEAERLIATAQEAGLVLMVDHVFLFSPAVQAMMQLHRDGILGDLLFIDSVRINLGVFQQDTSVLWDLAPHDLSIIDEMVGHPPRGLVAVGAAPAGTKQHSVAHLHLDYGDGLLASLHVNWLSPVKIRHFMVGGTRNSLLYNDLDQSEPIKVYDRGIDFSLDEEGRHGVLAAYRSGEVISPRVARTEPLQNLVNHFADCISGAAQPLSGGAQAVRILAILEAAAKSMGDHGRYTELEV
jgi:predicted dehydrogenase